MLPNPTLDKLQTLRLHGMIKALGEQHATPDINDLSFDERLGLPRRLQRALSALAALDGRTRPGPRRRQLRETDGGLCQDRLADPGRLGPGAIYRCATARHAGAAGRPLREPLDTGHQPDAGGQMARTDRRSDLGRCDPRPAGAQRLLDRTEGRIDAQTRNEIDGDRDFRLTMQTCVAALRLPVQVDVDQVSK